MVLIEKLNLRFADMWTEIFKINNIYSIQVIYSM